MKKINYLFILTTILLTTQSFSVDQNIDITINTQSEISFSNLTLSNSEFSLQENGSFEYDSNEYTNPTWGLINNEGGNTDIKVQGKFKSGSSPSRGWIVYATLNPPENSSGSFGKSAGEVELSASAKDFVTNIPKGKSGNLQTQKFRINATEEAWQAAASSGSESFVLEWTLTDQS